MTSPFKRLGTDTRYLLLGFPLGVLSFCLLLPGLVAGIGTAVVWLGLPILAGTLLMARGFANVARSRLPEILGRPVALPRLKRAPEGASRPRRMMQPLLDGQSWLDLLHGIVVFPVATITFVVTVAWWGVTLTGLLYPLFGWIIPQSPDNVQLPELLGLGRGYTVDALFYVAVGAVFGLTLPLVLRSAALLQAGLGRALLTGVAELRERIDDLTEGRAAAVSAEADALRRLERDIHDGPQQRLVHLAMELSRAQRQMRRDPQAAQATLAEAITATRDTLDELRALSRGIAPPILSDRGLAPALAALAGRCTVPVELDVQTAERYTAVVENTVYYVAAESLTNVAKHSRAQLCTLSLTRLGDTLVLSIGDDGVGGAHVAKGHGLSGLADRLRAVDGELAVQSPVGGPTLIVAEVPCG
ncbi:histidine kinase [Sphaerisporangium siamense]|uniref:histidine kinase n=1 Tax=Sphaerisporangium siamense TaxID=795645 RepID=A0A7W7DAV0_9ACTN|nr:sensor histidine kinase [Sphaerisporangium siamense]MBB4703174.1 signal transduction histidine kinase [Sphaerisporangium siamense]GII89194.1 histidine kinase [Sphaerisporangium siamense]